MLYMAKWSQVHLSAFLVTAGNIVEGTELLLYSLPCLHRRQLSLILCSQHFSPQYACPLAPLQQCYCNWLAFCFTHGN